MPQRSYERRRYEDGTACPVHRDGMGRPRSSRGGQVEAHPWALAPAGRWPRTPRAAVTASSERLMFLVGVSDLQSQNTMYFIAYDIVRANEMRRMCQLKRNLLAAILRMRCGCDDGGEALTKGKGRSSAVLCC